VINPTPNAMNTDDQLKLISGIIEFVFIVVNITPDITLAIASN
jgi:hypothetical protein